MRIGYGKKVVLKEEPEFWCEIAALENRTPFKQPLLIVKVGLSTMKVPSTTGTNTNVPKKPSKLML